MSSQLNELRAQAASRRAQNSRGNTPRPSPAVSEVASEAGSEIPSHAGSRHTQRSRGSQLLEVATAKSEISAHTATSDLDELLQSTLKSEKSSTHEMEITGVRNVPAKDNLAKTFL